MENIEDYSEIVQKGVNDFLSKISPDRRDSVYVDIKITDTVENTDKLKKQMSEVVEKINSIPMEELKKMDIKIDVKFQKRILVEKIEIEAMKEK